MRLPHGVRIAALVLAKTPGLTTAQVKSAILDNTDPVASLSGKTITGGRLNAAKAVGAPPTADFTLVASPSARSVVRGGSATYTVTLTRVNGFADPLTLSVSGLPSAFSAIVFSSAA